ncbi:MAG: pyridoxamine 5'-phosphate oxidase family protein [Anaerolineales bacterium]|nr:pyridoxamine 5'-phosphate oxidase family protein [Anaerolineales bacterium]
MTLNLPPDVVWQAIEKELFAVLGMVTARQEARTVGVVYVVRERRLYVGTGRDTWKARHVAQNPCVSVTIPIARRIPLMPWMKIPAATITFSGTARVLAAAEAPPGLLAQVFRGMAEDPARMAGSVVIEVTPHKEFVTYGVGVPLMRMRDPEQARGRAAVSTAVQDVAPRGRF